MAMREEIASKLRDINPPELGENIYPESLLLWPWGINWVRDHGGMNLSLWNKLKYYEWIEWMYRFRTFYVDTMKIMNEKPTVDKVITRNYLGYLSFPPVYLARGDLSFSTNQLLYGKYATCIWMGVDYWKAEFNWFGGYHLEEGKPISYWTVGGEREMVEQLTQDDLEVIKGAAPDLSVPCLNRDDPEFVEKWEAMMERRHLRLGLKLREICKKVPYDIHAWAKPVREILMDVREEQYPKWTHATFYISLRPGAYSALGVHPGIFWGGSNWWHHPWIAMNAERIFGLPMQFYTYFPIPPILNTLLALPDELFIRRLSELYLMGPKGLLCDALTKMLVPKEKAPLYHEMAEYCWKNGIYKGWASPYDSGMPQPRALLTALPGLPFYKEANIRDFIAKPENLPKQYWELLEAEAGVDRKSGRIPTYSEVPRLKWLFDPTIEWLKPKDFPPVDWAKGQVWPYDITREKMEIMVEEGYDGSGKDVLHYSALADKKMGQLGKIIMLGTTPYRLPVCGCSPHCG
jgi:hypothetical protein